MGLIESILSALLAKLLADESHAWTPRIIEYLIHRAICKLPGDQRERFGEEWRSDIDETPGLAAKLAKAVGFCFAAKRMARTIMRDRESQCIESFWDWFCGEFLSCFADAIDQESSPEEASVSGMERLLFRAQLRERFGPGDFFDIARNVFDHPLPTRDQLVCVTRSTIRQVMARGRRMKGIMITTDFPKLKIRRL